MPIDQGVRSSNYRQWLTIGMPPAISGRYVRSVLKNTCTCVSSSDLRIFRSIWLFLWFRQQRFALETASFAKDSLNFHTFLYEPCQRNQSRSESIIFWDTNDRWGSEDFAAHFKQHIVTSICRRHGFEHRWIFYLQTLTWIEAKKRVVFKVGMVSRSFTHF